VYAAKVDEQHLRFCVFGVWRKNMVMRDLETGTIWQHATGEAIDGPLKGRKLDVLYGWETTWGALRKSYPDAVYALKPEKYTGIIPKPILQRMLRITKWATLSGLSGQDHRLDPHQIVIGVIINGVAKVYPLEILRANPNTVDKVAGETIQLLYDAEGDQVVIKTSDGKRLHYERQWWAGWREFHPRSEIYSENKIENESLY